MASMRKDPSEFEGVSRVSPVCSLVAVILALATTAPEASRTVPARIPLLVWAWAVVMKNRLAIERTRKTDVMLFKAIVNCDFQLILRPLRDDSALWNYLRLAENGRRQRP